MLNQRINTRSCGSGKLYDTRKRQMRVFWMLQNLMQTKLKMHNVSVLIVSENTFIPKTVNSILISLYFFCFSERTQFRLLTVTKTAPVAGRLIVFCALRNA